MSDNYDPSENLDACCDSCQRLVDGAKEEASGVTTLLETIKVIVDSARNGTSFAHARALGEIDELLEED